MQEISTMSKNSTTSSSREGKDKMYCYTLRGKDVSDHAKKILKNVNEMALSEIQWTDVITGKCHEASCLIVFETGSSNSNRSLDILSGIRERAPSVHSIIAVILCTNNSMGHDKDCSSIDNHIFRTEKDIAFECLIFSDGGTHECSRNIGKSIESEVKQIQEKIKKKEKDTSKVKPAIEQKMRSKMNEFCVQIETDKDKEKKENKYRDKDKDNTKEKSLEDKMNDLEEAIKRFEEMKLEDNGDLTKAKNVLEKTKLEKELKFAIHTRRDLDKAIEATEKSKFKENFKPLLSKAKEVHDDLKKQGKYMFPIPDWKPEIIITELRGYKQPSKVIQDVVLAALVLLGEKKDTLQDWETVRYRMGPGCKPSLLQRIKDFQEKKQMKISADTKTEINGILGDTLLNNVRDESAGAAALFDWIRRYVPVEKHN